jgi:hypothetical protein
MLLRNQLYAGIVGVLECGVRGKCGDFEPLIEELFYRLQAILAAGCRTRRRASGRIQTFRCAASFAANRESCGRALTGSRVDTSNELRERPTVTAGAAARMRRPNPTSGSGTSAST